jgi:3-hydroxybutyryl-CoA dehydrogenase
MALKQKIFSSTEGLYDRSTIFASNTSSLSITEIASVLEQPGRFVGMHFFNPVPASNLVEIVVGAETSDATTNRIVELATLLDKTPIVVQDSPGFASSRLGLTLGLEAIRMVESGVASAQDIDAAMTLGYKHPIGPLKLTDLVGVDVRLAIAEHLARTLGERFEPPQLMRDMVAEGKLGKKSGQGFYVW